LGRRHQRLATTLSTLCYTTAIIAPISQRRLARLLLNFDVHAPVLLGRVRKVKYHGDVNTMAVGS